MTLCRNCKRKGKTICSQCRLRYGKPYFKQNPKKLFKIGEKNMAEKLKTEDYGPKTIRASTIPETGICITYKKLESGEGKYGEFFVLFGDENLDGINQEVQIAFNSQKLANLFRHNEKTILGKKIILSGYGEGVLRNYAVELL